MFHYVLFFVFKQKTAYEMRISDWSSDVCSSDLTAEQLAAAQPRAAQARGAAGPVPDQRARDHRGAKDVFGEDARRIRRWRDQPVQRRDPGRSLPQHQARHRWQQRRSEERRVGKEVSVRVDLGGRRIIKKKNSNDKKYMYKT